MLKMRKDLALLIWLQLFVGKECEVLPNDFQKCRFGNTTCIRDQANYLIRNYPKGIPSVGFRPLDAIHVKDVVVIDDRKVEVAWYYLQLLNQINYGFENTTITHVQGFDEDPTSSRIEIRGRLPRLIYKGVYVAKGRMLWLLNINSSGESESEFLNLHFDFTLKVQTEYRNNKRYLKIYQLMPNVSVDRWIQWLDNFFPENTDLTIAINRLFNENWVEFWNEIEKPILEIFTSVFLSIIENIFHNISYDDMFLTKDNK